MRQVAKFIVAAGTLGQRRAVGATIAASGTIRGPGSMHRLPHPSRSRGLGSSTVALVSTAVLAIIVFGSGQSIAIAPLLRVVRDVVALTRVLVWRGLIRRAV